MAGKLLKPDVPQWKPRVPPSETVAEDIVADLAGKVLQTVKSEVVPVVSSLAALQLVAQAILMAYKNDYGAAAADEAFRQADELAGAYAVYV